MGMDWGCGLCRENECIIAKGLIEHIDDSYPNTSLISFGTMALIHLIECVYAD